MQHDIPIIATPTNMAETIMEAMIAERVRGSWRNTGRRREFWTFAMSRSQEPHTHYEIATILSLDPEEVKRLLFVLMIKELVTLHTGDGREITMNAELLSQSFGRIKADGMKFATNFYKRLFDLADALTFEREEELVSLKKQATIDTDRITRVEADLALYRSVRDLFLHTSMQDQCRALLGALAVVIAGVTENRDIRKVLVELGARHRGYGVLPEHYPLVRQALIDTLRAAFGQEWTPELETTWGDAFDIISSIMITTPELP